MGDAGRGGTAAGRPAWWSRRGVATLVVAGLLALACAVLTAALDYPIGLGVMLGLAALYVATLYACVIGVVELRSGQDAGSGAVRARSAWLCLVTDHRYVRVGMTADAAEHWRCVRCGKRRWTVPTSAGETLNATRVDQLWIRRGDEM